MAEYIVDGTNGNDSGSTGPFKTISYGLNILANGDTLRVLTGLYREEAMMQRGGSRLADFKHAVADTSGGRVVVTGCDNFLPGAWTSEGGGVYSLDMTGIGDEHAYAVFVGDIFADTATHANPASQPRITNSSMLDESMLVIDAGDDAVQAWNGSAWQNVTGSNPGWAQTHDSTYAPGNTQRTYRFKCASIDHTKDWTGAYFHHLDKNRYNCSIGRVLSNDASYGVEVELPSSLEAIGGDYKGEPDLIGIYGAPHALAEGEWGYDQLNKTLRYWPPGGTIPAGGVEVQVRRTCFNARWRYYHTLDGFDIFAGNVGTDWRSLYIWMNNLNVKYVCPMGYYGAVAGEAGKQPNRYRIVPPDCQGTGVELMGDYCKLENSVIKYSWGDGVSMNYRNHVTKNCHVTEMDWGKTQCAPIALAPSSTNQNQWMRAEGNTLDRCARAAICHYMLSDSELCYNDITGSCLSGADTGATYTYNVYGSNDWSSDKDLDGFGARIHHNWVYSPGTSPRSNFGIYLDNAEREYWVYNNVVWDTLVGLITNQGLKTLRDQNIREVNNTVIDIDRRLSYWGGSSTYDLIGLEFVNNACTTSNDPPDGAVTIPVPADMSNNVGPGSPNALGADAASDMDLGLEDIANKDFRPAAGSPCIDAGKVYEHITIPSEYTGNSSPSAGAYEYGQPRWVPGYKTP